MQEGSIVDVERNVPVTVITKDTKVPPLVFPRQKAEFMTCDYTKPCHHCEKKIQKGTPVVVISLKEPKKGSPTYTFCDVWCQRRAYYERKIGNETWKTG